MKKKNIACDDLILGNNTKIAENVIISGGKIAIGDNTVIRSGVNINVSKSLEIGKNSIIGEKTIIKGRKIKLGREFYTNHHAEIGGGSCFEESSTLEIGYWFHLGSYSIINTAMPVKIGNEVGMGRFTNIYTHGAYQSAIDGFPVEFAPVTIGDRVWIPSATINPGVKIGNDVVIGVGSVVTKDIPSGSLAMGTPCEIIKKHHFPKKLSTGEKGKILENIFKLWNIKYKRVTDLIFSCNKTIFDFKKMKIEGKVSLESERMRNILRRNGIRFKIEIKNERYEQWK